MKGNSIKHIPTGSIPVRVFYVERILVCVLENSVGIRCEISERIGQRLVGLAAGAQKQKQKKITKKKEGRK